MEYLHASLILHSAGKKITEKAVTDVLTAAGVTPDKNRIKGLVASLADVNIEDALKSAAVIPAAVAAAPEPEEEEEEEESGLSSLFGWAKKLSVIVLLEHDIFLFIFFIFLFSFYDIGFLKTNTVLSNLSWVPEKVIFKLTPLTLKIVVRYDSRSK